MDGLITVEVSIEKETVGTYTQLSLYLEPNSTDDHYTLTEYLNRMNKDKQTLSYCITLSGDKLQPVDNPFEYTYNFLNLYLESQVVVDLFSEHKNERTTICFEISKYVDVLSKWCKNDLSL